MRVHKYRGKQMNGGGWLYGDLQTPIAGDEDCYSIISPTGAADVDPATVGQFTGMHDKDAREIYEGDTVKDPEVTGTEGIVEWEDGAFIVRWDGVRDLLSSDAIEPCITGNIHEEPTHAD